MKYFAKIKYLGTEFCGFQVQPAQRTVQGELSSACKKLFSSDTVKVTGCSRTDSGVHANEFCVLIECEDATVPPEKLPIAIARFLPQDLSLFYACAAPENFHPRYDVKSKEYLYRIKCSRISDPFDCGRVWFLPYEITEGKIELMRAAAANIVGYRDFTAFMSEGSDITDAHRTVHYVKIEQNNEYLDIKIAADGFLYNMVRIIVGTLVDVALTRISPERVSEIILSRNRALAGMTAPPDGLYLNRVDY